MRGEHGAIAVEFAIVLPILMLLVFGIIDFGHAYYMRHMMSDASREGARYGTRYQTNNAGSRILPKNLPISNYVLNTYGLTGLLPDDAAPRVTPGGPAATESNASLLAGENLLVTVTATKTWFVLGNLIPGFGNSTTLTVTTTMTCE